MCSLPEKNSLANPGYMHIEMKEHSAEMSVNKLTILLTILAIVWLLCHRAETQFPERHLLDTFERIGEKNITKQSIKRAVSLQLGKSPQQTKYWQYLSQKYEITKQPEQPLCIILIHQQRSVTPSSSSQKFLQSQSNLLNPQQKSAYMSSIESLLKQNYTDYKIFYLNNEQAGQEVYRFLEENALDRRKVNFIQKFQDNDYTQLFQNSKVYCGENDVVVYMTDEDRLFGKDTFSLINSLYSSTPSLQLLYTGSLIAAPRSPQKKFSYKVGKSYPYPAQIIKSSKYRQFPYIIDGLLTFKSNLFQEVETIELVNSQEKPYQYIGDVALGTILLKEAQGNIRYLPEPLLIRSRERNYVLAEESVKRELADLRQRNSV